MHQSIKLSVNMKIAAVLLFLSAAIALSLGKQQALIYFNLIHHSKLIHLRANCRGWNSSEWRRSCCPRCRSSSEMFPLNFNWIAHQLFINKEACAAPVWLTRTLAKFEISYIVGILFYLPPINLSRGLQFIIKFKCHLIIYADKEHKLLTVR